MKIHHLIKLLMKTIQSQNNFILVSLFFLIIGLGFRFLKIWMFLPLWPGYLRTSLRASLHERLCFYSNAVPPLPLTPEIERQMAPSQPFALRRSSQLWDRKHQTPLVTEHRKINVQRNVLLSMLSHLGSVKTYLILFTINLIYLLDVPVHVSTWDLRILWGLL